MKQSKILIFSVVVLAMLFAGGCTHTFGTDDGLTSSPELATQPAETQKPAAPSTEDTAEPTMQVMSPSDENVEKLSSSSNVPDESLISVDYATEELLGQYKSYEEFVESENTEHQAKILFKISAAVKDVRFLVIYFDESGDDDNLGFYVNKTLYSKDIISPKKPLVVGTVFEGLLPTRAISFVDENNTTRYYSLNMSGKDDSIFLIELVPRKTP